jgi:hypothetical protein
MCGALFSAPCHFLVVLCVSVMIVIIGSAFHFDFNVFKLLAIVLLVSMLIGSSFVLARSGRMPRALPIVSISFG